MEIKRILFPTDFSEGSANAIPYVVGMARQYGARLYILHVVYDIAKITGWYVPHVTVDELYADMETSARKEIERCCVEELRGFKDVDRVLLRGVPYEEIIKFAADNSIDLIVIGTHGRKGLDRMLFGSTAEQVVRNAPCPVLTVRVPMYKK